MILILTDFILTQVEHDKTHRKRIILDEAWELLKSQAAAQFHGVLREDAPKDWVQGLPLSPKAWKKSSRVPIGSAILNNTATKFVMLQRGSSEVLRETLKLNEQELGLIHSIEQRKGQYSEGFIIEGDHRQVIRVFPGPFEYWLSTSDAQDNQYLGTLRDQGLTLVEAIEKAARDYPNGFAAGPARGKDGGP